MPNFTVQKLLMKLANKALDIILSAAELFDSFVTNLATPLK